MNDKIGCIFTIAKIDSYTGILCGDYEYPYFVLEKIVDPEKKYVPFDLSDPEVRKSLRGRWIIRKDNAAESLISSFTKVDTWVAELWTSEELLYGYTFDDGTPCGKEVEE